VTADEVTAAVKALSAAADNPAAVKALSAAADNPAAVLDAVIEEFGLLAVSSAITTKLISNAIPAAPKPELAERNYTPEEIGVVVGYHRGHVYELIKSGALKHWREGKLIRVRQSALDEFIAEREMRGPLPLKVSNMLQSARDRRHHEAQPSSPGAHAKGTRSKNRLSPNNDLEVGSGHGTDP
jgi:excisionase family DNA binding protein